jgi:hypothetical protein
MSPKEVAMSKTVTRAGLITTGLTNADRCDRCGAAAKMRVELPPFGELLFCGHHARAHEAKLREVAGELS